MKPYGHALASIVLRAEAYSVENDLPSRERDRVFAASPIALNGPPGFSRSPTRSCTSRRRTSRASRCRSEGWWRREESN
jgi:hypothetical protein